MNAVDTSSPIVSVVMAVYNREKFVGRAIESVLVQTLGDFEFIIVDDGSTDGTGKVLREYAAKDDRIRIISQENQGLAASRNTGVAMSRGKYIAFMDSDDACAVNRLESQLDFLTRYPQYHACGCGFSPIKDYSPGIVSSGKHGVEVKFKSPFNYRDKDVSVVLNATSFITGKSFNQLGGYRRQETIIEDLDFTLRYRRRFSGSLMNGDNLYFCTYPTADNSNSSLSNQDVYNFTRRHISCFVSDWCCQNNIPDPVDAGKELAEILAILPQMPWLARYRIYWSMLGIVFLLVSNKGLTLNQARWYLLGLLKYPYPIRLTMFSGMILVKIFRQLERRFSQYF